MHMHGFAVFYNGTKGFNEQSAIVIYWRNILAFSICSMNALNFLTAESAH